MGAIDQLGTDAVALVVREQYRSMVQAVAVICGSLPDAEDAVQEAFARAWERAAAGERFDHLAGWVVSVALNQTRSGHRRRARDQELLARLGRRGTTPDGASSVDVLTAGALVMRDAVDELPLRQRQVVLLYYFLDFEVSVVASTLGISEGTVKTALFRARAKLAAALGEAPEGVT